MKIIFSLVVFVTPLYIWPSSSSQEALAQSVISSAKLVMPDAQKQASELLKKNFITEKERNGCISLLMGEMPSSAFNELTISLRRLQRDLESIEAEQKDHKAQNEAEQDARKKQRERCHQMHDEYMRLHAEATTEIESISMDFHMPNGKAEATHDRTLIILQMIQGLNELLSSDSAALESLLKKGEKTKDIQNLLRILDLGSMFTPKASQTTQSTSNSHGDAADASVSGAVNSDPMQKAKLAEQKKAEYLHYKQTLLHGVLEKSTLLLQSLDQEENFYVQKYTREVESFTEKLTTTRRLIDEARKQLEEKNTELTKYNDLIQAIRSKKVRS